MDLYKKVYRVIFFTFFVGIFLFNAPPVGAFFLTDWLTDAKDFVTGVFAPKPKSEFTVDSTITLAPDGDYDKNGEIDAGDMVTFSYNIQNDTDNSYNFLSLNTNIPTSLVTYISNVRGAKNLSNREEFIIIPNLQLNPHQTLLIQFDAHLLYFQDSDRVLSIEPEILSEDKKQLFKSGRKEIKVKSWKSRELPSMLRIKTKN